MKILEEMAFIGACLCMALFTGCSQKTVGSSDSSAQILNSYVKKEAPAGWYYNFGIGKNYELALSDADKALSFKNPITTNTTVVTFSNFKYVTTDPYNVYSSKSYCEVKENWDVPEGLMIVRLCPDMQFFRDNYDWTTDTNRWVKASDVKTKALRLLNEYKKANRDNAHIYEFEFEVNIMEKSIFYSNFIDFSAEEVMFWVNTTYKKWYESLGGFKNHSIKVHYGIIYPHLFYYDGVYTNSILNNQMWIVNETGAKASRKFKLSKAQLMGITPKPDSMHFKYIESGL